LNPAAGSGEGSPEGAGLVRAVGRKIDEEIVQPDHDAQADREYCAPTAREA